MRETSSEDIQTRAACVDSSVESRVFKPPLLLYGVENVDIALLILNFAPCPMLSLSYVRDDASLAPVSNVIYVKPLEFLCEGLLIWLI